MDYVEHITNEGDRWDLLAYRYYGDPYQYERIIVANVHVPIVPILDSGLRLRIPVLDDAAVLSDSQLPPWKRA